MNAGGIYAGGLMEGAAANGSPRLPRPVHILAVPGRAAGNNASALGNRCAVANIHAAALHRGLGPAAAATAAAARCHVPV
jgi:hypothetical protein